MNERNDAMAKMERSQRRARWEYRGGEAYGKRLPGRMAAFIWLGDFAKVW